MVEEGRGPVTAEEEVDVVAEVTDVTTVMVHKMQLLHMWLHMEQYHLQQLLLMEQFPLQRHRRKLQSPQQPPTPIPRKHTTIGKCVTHVYGM